MPKYILASVKVVAPGMTTLILAQRKILSGQFAAYRARTTERFLEINPQGWLSAVILGFILASTIFYLGALYLTFDLGFKIQESSKTLSRTQGAALKAEFVLQQNLSKLAQGHSDILQSMEKASQIKYLTPENLAVSYTMTKP